MFEVEKPRQFHYQPRFYDPEKEKWESLKKKYAIEQEKKAASAPVHDGEASDDELAYFQQKVRNLERQDRDRKSRLGWKDLFRKREMPQFHYTPRFDEHGNLKEEFASATGGEQELENKYAETYHAHPIKIRRRFDISDEQYFKPISGTKIILYVFLTCMLIYWVLF